jgi:Tfp pilus assembly protein PilF
MKPAALSLALLSLLACGCLLPGREGSSPARTVKQVHKQARRLLWAGITAYNNGNTIRARDSLDSVLEKTRGHALPDIQAAAHFYLAAAAWDLGDKKKTDRHLQQCRTIKPTYRPDWTFIAPSLRRRFEAPP